METLNPWVAFVAGLTSFFAPCVVPLAPVYISYVTGASIDSLKEKGHRRYVLEAFISSLFYVLGFSLIFVLLGAAAAGVGVVLRQNAYFIQRIGGVLIIIFGLDFLGVIKLPVFYKLQPKVTPHLGAYKYLKAFLLGIVFAFTWSPCVGGVLGSVLALAAVSASLPIGATLLLFYSIGISVPFVIFSLILSSLPKYVHIISKYSRYFTTVSGLLLVLLGILLFTDTYKYLNAYIFNLGRALGFL